MKVLCGFIKRVTCRKGIVGRGWLKQGTVHIDIPSASRPNAGRITPRLQS